MRLASASLYAVLYTSTLDLFSVGHAQFYMCFTDVVSPVLYAVRAGRIPDIDLRSRHRLDGVS